MPDCAACEQAGGADVSIRVLGNNGDSGLWYVNGVLVLHTDEQHKVTERARGLLLLATRIPCLLLAQRRYRGAVVSVGGCLWQGEVLGGDLVEASDDGSESEVRPPHHTPHTSAAVVVTCRQQVGLTTGTCVGPCLQVMRHVNGGNDYLFRTVGQHSFSVSGALTYPNGSQVGRHTSITLPPSVRPKPASQPASQLLWTAHVSVLGLGG